MAQWGYVAMSSPRIKTYVLRLYLATFALFIFNKFALRPFALEQECPAFLTIVVLSAPNTFEAIIGMSTVTALLMRAKLFSPRLEGIPNLAIYLLATVVAGIYVLTQEFKLHDLGGRNVYDPYDVVASIVGLVGTLLLFWRYGFLERVSRAS